MISYQQNTAGVQMHKIICNPHAIFKQTSDIIRSALLGKGALGD